MMISRASGVNVRVKTTKEGCVVLLQEAFKVVHLLRFQVHPDQLKTIRLCVVH